jgi:hypothetical protein
MEEILKTILIPEKWRDGFEIKELIQREKEVNMVLVEKGKCVPKSLKGKNYVLNGYMDPIEIIDYPFRGRLMYITFLRRRWKEPGEEGGNVSHFNTYEFHRPGMKTTDEFGDFLKELDREEFNELCRVWPVLRNLRKKNLSLVQKYTQWLYRSRSETKTS